MVDIKSIIRKSKIIYKIKITKDISNTDLSNLDFSDYPAEFWKDVIIDNCNFSNSKINFNPQFLPRPKRLINVNFENVDLSYLKDSDFDGIEIDNCNFCNTGLNLELYVINGLNNTKLDKGIKISPITDIDYGTLELNPDYPFTDFQVVMAITKTFPNYLIIKEECIDNPYNYYGYSRTKEEYFNDLNEFIEKVISVLYKYKRYNIINLIKKMCNNMYLGYVVEFLRYPKSHIPFKNMNFTLEDVKCLEYWELGLGTVFENCTFNISYDYANKKSLDGVDLFSIRHRFNNCSFSDESYKNLQNIKIKGTPFSSRTSLYVKVDNECNGSCSFCKNKTESDVKTDISSVVENLTTDSLLLHLNDIYIGGGEPTLYLDKVKYIYLKLKKTIINKNIDMPNFYLFTNGSGNWEKLFKEFSDFKVILSRHEIDNEKNKQITGVDYDLEDPYLKKLIYYNRLILSLTCSDLNMRDRFLEEYFHFGKNLGINNFIIQTLEEKTDIKVKDIDKYLDDFETYLMQHGNMKKQHIVSTSYFDLELIKGYGCNISLKKYFEPCELESHLIYEPKHSFDLGMDCNGEIYNDFQMIKKLKR